MQPIATLATLSLSAFAYLSVPTTALAQTAAAEPMISATAEPPPAAELPLRLAKPAVISVGGLWPKGLGPGFSYQLAPQLALGAHAGFALFFADISAFGRWYFAETPASWYLEGLAVQHFSLGSGYLPAGPFFSLNALGGWEYRWRSGASFNIGAGLGVSPNMTPDAIIGLLNLDLSFGYAF